MGRKSAQVEGNRTSDSRKLVTQIVPWVRTRSSCTGDGVASPGQGSFFSSAAVLVDAISATRAKPMIKMSFFMTVSDRGYRSPGNETTRTPVPDRGSLILKGTSEGPLA